MNTDTFLDSFGHIADAPSGIDRLRSLILELAVRGKLTAPDPAHGSIRDLLTPADATPEGARGARRHAKHLGHGDIGVAPPFDLPESWEWVSLGQVSSDIHYGLTAKASPTAGDPAFVRITDIKRGAIQWGDVPGCVDPGVNPERFLLQIGDILVARSGSVGVSTVVRDLPRQAVFASYLIRIIPTQSWLSSWWPVVAGSGMYWRQVGQSTTGSAQKNINSTNMRRWIIPVPPKAEQARIIARVDGLLSLCDELEQQQGARTVARSALTASTLTRVTDAGSVDDLRTAFRSFTDNIGLHLAPGESDLVALNRVRQTILDLAVRGRLSHRDSADEPTGTLVDRVASERARLVETKAIRRSAPPTKSAPRDQAFSVPSGWAWSTLGQLTLTSDSGWSPACLPSGRSNDTQWAVLKISAVTWGSFRQEEHKLLGPDLAPRESIEVRHGDFLMSRANTAELVGRSVVVAEPPPRLMLSDKLVRLRFLDHVTAEYVNLVNASSATRAYYASVSSGTSASMRNITREQILALAVPLPPLEEQGRIVHRVAELSALCEDLETHLIAARVLRGNVAASVAAHAASGTNA